MAPCQVTDDYYEILEVSQTASVEIVKKSYRRLAVALHPDKNPNKPSATAAFQSLSRAYETISDPDKRRDYDKLWANIVGSRKAAQEERDKAAEETLKTQRELKASQERLQQLKRFKIHYERDIFEKDRQIRRLTADLKRLQDQDDEEDRKEKVRNSWYRYLTSPFYGKVEETEEQKQQRQNERLQRLAIRSIKKHELSGLETGRRTLQGTLEEVSIQIESEKQKNTNAARERERKKHEQLRKEQEAKRQEQVEKRAREFRAEFERTEAERRKEEVARAAKKAQEAKEAQEAREARARMQAAQQARDAQIRAQAARETEATRQRAKTTQAASTASKGTHRRVPTFENSKNPQCGHRAFWAKLDGSHLCTSCQTVQRRFAFQCPGCEMIACADCRQILRGEKPRNRRGPKKGAGDYPYHQSDDGPFMWDDLGFD